MRAQNIVDARATRAGGIGDGVAQSGLFGGWKLDECDACGTCRRVLVVQWNLQIDAGEVLVAALRESDI